MNDFVCFFLSLCVCVLFPFPVKVSLHWTKNNCNVTVQDSDGILRKYFCTKDLGKAIIERTFQVQTVKGWSIATFLLANLGNRSDSALGQILSESDTTPGGVTFVLEKIFLILSNQYRLRSWHCSWENPLNLTVVAATLSWALLAFLSPRQDEFHRGSNNVVKSTAAISCFS